MSTCCLFTHTHTYTHALTQIRRPIGTVFELILPVIAVIFIVGLRYVCKHLACLATLGMLYVHVWES